MKIKIVYSGKSTKYPYDIQWNTLYNHKKLKEFYLKDTLPLSISLAVYRNIKKINNDRNMALLEMTESKKENLNKVDEWSRTQLIKLLLYITDLEFEFTDDV